jgi:formylglycine-generating enzyme required for sulfatase activity
VKKGLTDSTDLKGYSDGALFTASVMSYPANKLGIYDLGGNVWEWCQDLYAPDSDSRMLRGGSWHNRDRDDLASSYRGNDSPVYRGEGHYGIRCVVVVGASSP